MTDIEINIAIAQFCGYKWLRVPDAECSDPECWTLQNDHFRSGNLGPVVFEVVDTLPSDAKKWKCHIPSYTTDLNAMWEAELKLDDESYKHFAKALTRIRGNGGPLVYKRYSANARQRAEALLRTIGKWTE